MSLTLQSFKDNPGRYTVRAFAGWDDEIAIVCDHDCRPRRFAVIYKGHLYRPLGKRSAWFKTHDAALTLAQELRESR